MLVEVDDRVELITTSSTIVERKIEHVTDFEADSREQLMSLVDHRRRQVQPGDVDAAAGQVGWRHDRDHSRAQPFDPANAVRETSRKSRSNGLLASSPAISSA